MNWILTHAAQIVAAVGVLHVVAVAIVNSTKTPADDAWLAKIYPWIEKAAGLLSDKAKLLPGEEPTPKV